MDYKEQQKQMKEAWKKSRAGTPLELIQKDGQLYAMGADRTIYGVPTHIKRVYSKKQGKVINARVTNGFERLGIAHFDEPETQPVE